MSRPYVKAAERKKPASGSDLDKFSKVFRQQIKSEYALTFGLGELVAKRREELEISQTALSITTGIPQADISRIECGKANPTINTLEKILDALHLKLTVLNK